MNFFRLRAAQTLPEWLESATGGLVPSAQARVRAEIEAHYAEAVQTRLDHGSPAADAHAAALADLGDAYAAARRFHGQHLTKQDAAQIGWCLQYAFLLSVIALGMSLPVITLSLPSRPHLPGYDASSTQAGTMLLLWLMVITASIAAQILTGQKTTTATVRQLLLLYALFAVGVGGLFVMIGNGHGINPALTLKDNTVMIAYFAYIIFNFFRLRQKLLTAGENDLPPSTPAALHSCRRVTRSPPFLPSVNLTDRH